MLKRFLPLIFCWLHVLSAPAYADKIPGADKTHETAKPDVRVIIDISGSMKQNDPENLRRPALELLVQLFPEDSKAGVWTFGQWVNMLVKHQLVDEKWRAEALQQAQKINSVALHTNIPAALEKAVDDFDRLDASYQTSLILLTDGMVDVSKKPEENTAARQRVLSEILPKLAQAGVTIHTVALSQNADKELMDALALETGGLSEVAETAEDLTRIFLQAFDAAAPTEELPLEGNSFLVDSSVEEFTALIFRKPGSEPTALIGPDKKRYSRDMQASDVKWFSQQNYDLITITRPYEGEWTVVADLESNSRVTVVSDMSLVIDRLPINHYVGDQPVLSGSLQEKGEVITRSELLSLVEVTVNVERTSDQKRWSFSLTGEEPAPADGVFSTALDMLDKADKYQIEMIVDGKTFRRQQSQFIKVRHAFVTDVERIESEKQTDYRVTLTPKNRELDLINSSVLAQISKPDGTSTMKPAVLEDGSWFVLQAGGDYSGEYQIVFAVDAKLSNGEKVFYRTSAISFDHEAINPKPLPAAEEKPEPAPVVEEKPEPKPELVKQVELADQDDGLPIWVWIAIIVGNLIIIGLGYLAWRIVMGDKNSSILEKEDIVEDDEPEVVEEAVAEKEAHVEIAEHEEPPVEQKVEEPSHDEPDDDLLLEDVEIEQADEAPDVVIEQTEEVTQADEETVTTGYDSDEVDKEIAADTEEELASGEGDKEASEEVSETDTTEESVAEEPEEDDDLGLPDDVIDLELSTDEEVKGDEGNDEKDDKDKSS